MDQIEFMRWLDSKEGEQYWEKDEKGEKSQILRAGWARAQIEYDRIKQEQEQNEQNKKQ
jgi:hypothetical protein